MRTQLTREARLSSETVEHNHITKCSVPLHTDPGVADGTHRGGIIMSSVYVCVLHHTNPRRIPASQAYSAPTPGSEWVFTCCSGNKCNHCHFCSPLCYRSSSLPHCSASLVRDPNLCSARASPLLLSHKGPITPLSCSVRSRGGAKSLLGFSYALVRVKPENRNNNKTFTTYIRFLSEIRDKN